jgi:serine/threonine protein kinase
MATTVLAVETRVRPGVRAATTGEAAATREAGAAVIELATGTRLAGGRYLLERPLGAGGMASVWLARDARLSRPVAVKILADSLASDPGYLERFRREAQLAAGLSHPNLVSVFDYASEHERPYLVMEFVPGSTLADRLGSGDAGALDAAMLAHQLLAALEHIHTAGIVHRDIKPSNVLLGPDGRARLTDFGIARPEGSTALTATGEIMGTLRYLAPELLRGERATPRSDLYACGVVLSQVLDDGSPSWLSGLVDSLTADEPAQRPASAGDALSRWPGGTRAVARRRFGGTARPPGPPGQPTPVTRRPAGPLTPATPATAPVPRPRPARASIPPSTRAVPAWSRRAGVAALVVAILVTAAVILIGEGQGRRSTPAAAPAPAPARAPLGRQLDGLERTARSLARH